MKRKRRGKKKSAEEEQAIGKDEEVYKYRFNSTNGVACIMHATFINART
jgi:hypothetical protein